MKTKLFITFCFLASTIMVMRAQDIITKTNGDEIKAKVTEVGVSEIKYKKFENVSGPTYTIAKSDIFMIKYENGEKDMFGKSADASGVSGQTSTQDPSSSEPVRQKLQTTRQALQNSSQTGQSTTQQQNVTTSQFVPVGKTQFGIKGGLNFASESGDNGEQTGSRTGLHIGFFLETPISQKVGFQPELVYSMQGGSFSGGTRKLDYINLPLMFKFYVWQQRFSIDAGLQFGYLISAKEDSYDIYDLSSLQKFDVSICVGVSYKITNQLDVYLHGIGGMTKIFKGYTNANSVGQLGVGYRF